VDICKSKEKCGGCCYQGVEYKDQFSNKAGEVQGILKEAGIPTELFLGIKECPSQYSYRNKMEYTFGDEVKGGEMHLGLHEKGKFMNIVDVSECQLVHKDFNLLVETTLNFALEKGYTHYNRKSHTGLCRNLIIRRGVRTNEIVVNIVTTSDGNFDEESYKETLLGLNLDHTLVGIIHTFCDSVSDAVTCEKLNIIYGREYYNEEIMGLKFKVGPFSFFQTNVEAAERLYKDAISLIDNFEGKTVFDLYCGTGTITQALATKAGHAIGVEIVEEAIVTAKESAKVNNLNNCTFIAGDVNQVLKTLEEKPDVIVVDPPRSGIVPKAMQQILDYGVDQIVYISCNPKTMVPNLTMAQLCGYSIKQIQAYDNFPFTKHIESICLLEKDL